MPDEPLISVVLVTYNRLGFLQQALQALFDQVDLPAEIIIWNNASADGTAEWLATVTDPRVQVINHLENIGCNAYEYAFRQTRGQWLVEMDDDVLELPEGFLGKMIAAFAACPDLGYLALDVVRDDKTNGAKPEEYAYTEETCGGVTLQFGPTGGWCAMTRRSLWEEIHYPLIPGAKHFYEDGLFCEALRGRGLRHAILKGVCCYHAVGVWWLAQYQEYWEERFHDDPDELRKMRLFLEKGVLIKDAQRPFSLRKLAGDVKRTLKSWLRR
jgi:GT2 family glycosyltransferase